jgi:hypothetical protein
VYILVRRDLSSPQQAVQSCHAAIEAALSFGRLPDHPSVIICGIATEAKLENALCRLNALGIRCHAFREPDIGNQLTAIACEPVYGEQRRIFRQYQLLTERASLIGGAA